jgi:hypothetical protein
MKSNTRWGWRGRQAGTSPWSSKTIMHLNFLIGKWDVYRQENFRLIILNTEWLNGNM